MQHLELVEMCHVIRTYCCSLFLPSNQSWLPFCGQYDRGKNHKASQSSWLLCVIHSLCKETNISHLHCWCSAEIWTKWTSHVKKFCNYVNCTRLSV